MIVLDQFRDAIRAAGMTPPDVIEPGRFYRFPGQGKHKGNTAGWCKLFPDGLGGTFGDYSRDLAETWPVRRDRPMSLMEREAWHRELARAKAEAESKRAEDQADAAKRAAELWEKATPATTHPYLTAKGVQPHGVRVDGATLLVPMRAGGEVANLQRIAPDGAKRFLPGARVTGTYHSIGRPNGTICIAEGYATGASVHEATGHAMAVAFNAGNLAAVAAALRERFPDARLILCADDDAATEGNPGVTKAMATARTVGGLVAVPDFGANRPDGATDFNDLHRHRGAEAVERAIACARAPDVGKEQHEAGSAAEGNFGGEAWPDPEPLTTGDEVQPYPLDALPAGIREAVEEVVGFVQCPSALVACSALSALSLAGQALADVERAATLKGPVSLYLLAVGDSGERKTTCDNYFLHPIREWEREEAERAKPDIARYAAEVAAWEERRAGIKARIRGAAGKEGGDCGALTRELAEAEAERPLVLRVPRLIHADATPEALAWSLASGWPSGGVMSSEAGIVFGGHGMGRESVMRNLALLNALWEGTMHRVDRRASDCFTVEGARLTMGLATQPETVRQFIEATKGLARGIGFAARFLFAAPRSTQGTRLFRDPPSWRALPAFAGRVRQLLAIRPTLTESGALTPATLTLSRGAREVWRTFHDDVERELRQGGDMAEVRDVGSKAADNVARLAALFHVYASGPTGEIGPQAVEAAARVVGWHLYQARAFLGDVATPSERSIARRLDAWLLDRCARDGVQELPRRSIQNEGPNPVRSRTVLDAALAELEEAGRVREVAIGKRKLVRVNPALLGGADGAP